MLPEFLPLSPEEIVAFVTQRSKKQALIFWGSGKVYASCTAWPSEEEVVHVPAAIKTDARGFFQHLLTATKGFFFLDSDIEENLQYLRGYDYRCSGAKGLALVLGTPFVTQVAYDQARARVRRGTDEGSVFVLQRKMWSK